MKPAVVLLLDGSKLFSLNDNMHVVGFFFFFFSICMITVVIPSKIFSSLENNKTKENMLAQCW